MSYIVNILTFVAIAIFTYFLFGIILPYILLPNFLFKQKLENNSEIFKLSRKLRQKSEIKTLKKVYNFVTNHFQDYEFEFDIKHLNRFYELFELHDYKVRKLILLHRKKFLWCYAQNKVLFTILRHTGQFNSREVRIKVCLSPHFTIHQYLLVKIGNRKIRVDPFYHKFKVIYKK
jgi:hypothetical protein